MSRLHFDTTLETIRHARQDALEDYDMARRKYEEYLKKCDKFKNMVEIKQDHLRCLDAQDQQTLQQQLVQPGYRLRAEGDDWLMSPAGSAP